MSTTQEQTPKKLTAAQRIEQLEQAMVSVFHTVNTMASDLLRLRGDVQMLDNKLSSTIALINGGLPITNENLAAAMTKNNVDALAAVVKKYVEAGIFAPQEEVPTLVGEGFIAVRETTQDGKIISPRRQMLLTEMPLEVAEKLMGQKVGATVLIGEGEAANNVEILEAYKIQQPSQEEPAPANA